MVADAYAEETGNPVYRPARAIEVHPQVPWLLCSLDRLTEVGGRGRLLECKTVRYGSEEWGEQGTDQVPDHYLLQCQHQLLVSGFTHCHLAALFGGQELRVYSIERNEELQGRMRRIMEEFWGRVQDRRPPPPTWSHPETPALIDRMQRLTPGASIDLDREHGELAQLYCIYGREIGLLEKKRKLARAKLIHVMGDAEAAVAASGHQLKRKHITRAAYEVAETSYWELRVKEPKVSTVEVTD